jgi:hypothetical protein
VGEIVTSVVVRVALQSLTVCCVHRVGTSLLLVVGIWDCTLGFSTLLSSEARVQTSSRSFFFISCFSARSLLFSYFLHYAVDSCLLLYWYIKKSSRRD